MSDVIHIRSFYEQGAASSIQGRRVCCRCGGYARKDDIYILQLLRGTWMLRKANDMDRKVLCPECAEKAYQARQH